MPVCSRPFHHARSLPSSFLLPLRPPCQILSFDLPFRRAFPRMCLIFAVAVDFRPLAPACASTCVHLRINPSSLFSRVTLSHLSFPPLRLFRHNPHVAAMSCVTFILAYVLISHHSLFYFCPTINTLSRSVFIFGCLRDING